MTRPLDESAIVTGMANAVACRVRRRTVAALQRLRGTVSGDDSELHSVWDELCVQVQNGESLYWDAYDETVKQIASGFIRELQGYERDALWLQSEAGIAWHCVDPEVRSESPVSEDDIIDYVVQEYVYAEAGRWSNTRIRAYIERSGRSD